MFILDRQDLHYFLLTGHDLKKFKNDINDIDLVGRNASSLILWTDRGVSRHCKILHTMKHGSIRQIEVTYSKGDIQPQTQAQPAVVIEDGTERNLVAAINALNRVDVTDSRDIGAMELLHQG